MAMQTNSGRTPEPYAFALVPECRYCGAQMRVTAAAVTAQAQDVTYECFACLMQVHRHSRLRSADLQG